MDINAFLSLLYFDRNESTSLFSVSNVYPPDYFYVRNEYVRNFFWEILCEAFSFPLNLKLEILFFTEKSEGIKGKKRVRFIVFINPPCMTKIKNCGKNYVIIDSTL